jgi:AcrR family transcriptional regulator
VSFARARTDEQVASRQEEIINACDALFSQHGYEGVHFKAISKMTSFKRPTIYNYYKSKDEALLDLLKREMLDWNAAMQEMINNVETMTKEQYSAFLTETTVPRDKMLALLTILCTNIENQCGMEKLTEFKRETSGVFTTLFDSLNKYFPHAAFTEKNFFVTAFLSYIHGLYPLTHLTKKQTDAMTAAGMVFTKPDFKDIFCHGILLLLSGL